MQPPSHSIPRVVEHTFVIESHDDDGLPLDDEQARAMPVIVRFLEEHSPVQRHEDSHAQAGGAAELRSTYSALSCVRYIGEGKYQCRFITTRKGRFVLQGYADGKQVLANSRICFEV